MSEVGVYSCPTCVVDGALVNKRPSHCLFLEARWLLNKADLLNL